MKTAAGCPRFAAVLIVASALVLVHPVVSAQQFRPMNHGGDNTENRTGLWFCVQVGGAGKALPLPARLYATKDSVTDGVALRVDVRAGEKGAIVYENSPWPANTAGITLYAKASEDLDLTVKGRVTFAVTREWKKIDLAWKDLGTTPEARNIGYQFAIGLAKPTDHTIWVIIDRIGTEGPAFDPAPKVAPEDGPDEAIRSADLVGNAKALAPTVARLKAKKPFKIVAFGDSVTAGSQAQRGNWNLKGADLVAYLYFADLARSLEARYGYQGITPVQNGYGGWTAQRAKSIMDKVFAGVGADDVVIIEFGANDMGWAGKSVDQWLADLKILIDAAKKQTSQIVITSPTTGGRIPKLADEISRKFRAFAEKENVAWVDITRWSLYRGEKFAWAYLANEYHPDVMGHVMMAEIMETLFGSPEFTWPPYVAGK